MEAGWYFDNSYARLPELFFSRLDPVPVAAPKLVAFNDALAEELGLNADVLRADYGAAVFAGNHVPDGGGTPGAGLCGTSVRPFHDAWGWSGHPARRADHP